VRFLRPIFIRLGMKRIRLCGLVNDGTIFRPIFLNMGSERGDIGLCTV
jgi:hypothetical protein